MIDILFVRTFFIVGAMLLLTAITAKKNRYFETSVEMWSTIIASFGLLFAIMAFKNQYPLNLVLVGLFSLVVGWSMGPTIEHFGMRFKLRKFLKEKGNPLKKGQHATEQQLEEFRSTVDVQMYHEEWQNKITLALLGTSGAVVFASSTVFLTDIDFSFLGGFLFVALSLLVLMSLLNVFFFKSKMKSLVMSYCGAVIFTLYLFYDFDQLKKHAGDESWATAIDISVNIYLDIINLFLDLLEILAEAD